MSDAERVTERFSPAALAMAAIEHQQWCDARTKVLAALQAGRQWIAVLGPSGTGKTLLLRDLARALAGAGGTTVQTAAEPGRAPALMVTSNARVIMLVDDADQHGEAILAALAVTGGPQRVVAGPSTLADQLFRHVPGGEMVALAPLSPDAAKAYLAMWLLREELPRRRFTSKAAAELIAAAAGVPRILNEIAGRAEWLATDEGARRVTVHHVHEAVAFLQDVPSENLVERLSDDEPLGRGLAGVSVPTIAWSGGLAVIACVGFLVVRAITVSPPSPTTATVVADMPLAAPATSRAPDKVAMVRATPSSGELPVADPDMPHQARKPAAPPPQPMWLHLDPLPPDPPAPADASVSDTVPSPVVAPPRDIEAAQAEPALHGSSATPQPPEGIAASAVPAPSPVAPAVPLRATEPMMPRLALAAPAPPLAAVASAEAAPAALMPPVRTALATTVLVPPMVVQERLVHTTRSPGVSETVRGIRQLPVALAALPGLTEHAIARPLVLAEEPTARPPATALRPDAVTPPSPRSPDMAIQLAAVVPIPSMVVPQALVALPTPVGLDLAAAIPAPALARTQIAVSPAQRAPAPGLLPIARGGETLAVAAPMPGIEATLTKTPSHTSLAAMQPPAAATHLVPAAPAESVSEPAGTMPSIVALPPGAVVERMLPRPPTEPAAPATAPAPSQWAAGAGAVPAASGLVIASRVVPAALTPPARTALVTTVLVPPTIVQGRLVDTTRSPGVSETVHGIRQQPVALAALPDPTEHAIARPLVLAEEPTARPPATALRPAPVTPSPTPVGLDLAAAIPAPDLARTQVAASPAQHAPAPGLLLIARGGETLGSLYEKVYRGVVPPPFEAVAAANPKPIRRGDVLVFPPPPAGWKKQSIDIRS